MYFFILCLYFLAYMWTNVILQTSFCSLHDYILILKKEISVRKLFLGTKDYSNKNILTTLLLLLPDSTKKVSILYITHVYFTFGRGKMKYWPWFVCSAYCLFYFCLLTKIITVQIGLWLAKFKARDEGN